MSAGPTAAAATRQIRGSALLLGGRGVSVVLNFAVQVLVVRYLTKLDYGAFAFAHTMVTMLTRLSRFGMDKAASRFGAIYHERREPARLIGALLVMTGTIVVVGLGSVLLAFGLRGVIGERIVSSPLSLTLLLTMIVLAPLDALDTLFQSVFSVFSRARLIFFRRHVVGPSLKLLAVVGVMLAGGDVRLLAIAHVVAGFCGLAIGATLLVRVLRESAALRAFSLRGLSVPVRSILGFGLPMMASDLAFVFRGSLVVALLEFFHGGVGVADYRAVLPAARLNRVVVESFAFLFMPAVTRLLVRGQARALNDLFWRSAVWVAVLSLPMFLLTFSFAGPLTVLLFGAPYAGAGSVLAILSVGLFLQAALELNALVLKAAGKIRQVLTIDLLQVAISLVLALLLVPRFGAVGGALALSISVMAHALMYQIGLTRSTGVRFLPWKYLRIYATLLGVAGLLVVVQRAWSPPMPLALALVAAGCLLVFASGRRLLEVDRTFPELLRLPLVGRWLRGGMAAERFDEPLLSELRGVADRLGEDGHGTPRIEWVRCMGRRAETTLHEFEALVGERPTPLVVKVPRAELAGRGDDYASRRRQTPRIGLWCDPRTSVRYEYETLRAIDRHFEALGDARFGTVRPRLLLPESGALVMEHVGYPNLRSLLAGEGRRPWRRPPAALVRALHDTGAWLRVFHGLPRLAHTADRRTKRSEFLDSLDEFSEYLIEAGHDPRFLRAVVAETRRRAAELLPERLPAVLGHGDLAPRNVLVGPGGRIVVLDTPGRWSFPLYQDIGYFLTALRTSALRVTTLGIAIPAAKLAALEEAFLSGYFADDGVPRDAIRLFEVQTLLSRWVSAVDDHRRAGGATRLGRRFALGLKSRFCARCIESALGVRPRRGV